MNWQKMACLSRILASCCGAVYILIGHVLAEHWFGKSIAIGLQLVDIGFSSSDWGIYAA